MKDILAGKIYAKIEAANKPRVFEHTHASSIGQCPRSQYYQRLGVKPTSRPTPAKMLRWQSGHLMEAAIRPYLKELYPDLRSNCRLISEHYDLTGEYDNYSEEAKTLIEIKTVGPRAPRYKKVSEDRHNLREDGPYLAHEYQNHAYALLLKEFMFPIENITYVYITLEGLLITYDTKVQENLLDNVTKRLALLKLAHDEGYLPPCLCNPDHPLWGSAMQFCPYASPEKGGICCEVTKEIRAQIPKQN